MLKSFSLSFGSFIFLDLLWFTFAVKNFNLERLAEVGRIKDGQFDVLYIPAVAAYFLMALAVSVFLRPTFKPHDQMGKIFLKSALLGIIIYGIYDLTNLALLKNYPTTFAMVDMMWGTFAFGVVGMLVGKFSPLN